MNTIGAIKLPKSADISDLYVQCNEAALLIHQQGKNQGNRNRVVLSQRGTVSSNSYFNSFYERFYAKYTTLHSVYYRLKLEGDFRVSVYREADGRSEKEKISEEKFEECRCSNPVELSAINLRKDENAGRIYIEITCLSEQGIFEGGWIATDEQKAREVSLGIVICTFKKEDYIQNTIAAILQDELLQDKDFKVFIVDNGKTLDRNDFRNSRLKLIPNKNAGGSGGFTRGLIEALAENSYSHFLLMDDDIELESESICRLFSLHEYAKIDFAVAGGLLDLQKKYVLYEAGASYSEDAKARGFAPGSLTALNHNVDLRKADSLNSLLVEADPDYGGFWFFSFSRELVEQVKLPLPLFIKIDDIEFCLRLKKFLGVPIVTFPSIGVWHQPASAKNLNWETYYYARNDLITFAIHYSPEYTPTVSHLSKAILRAVAGTDYDYAQMLIKAFEDYLKGPDFIKTAEPDVLHRDIIKLSRSYETQMDADSWAGIKLLARWAKVAARGRMEWSSVTQNWKSAAKEMATPLFWQQYLGLEEPAYSSTGSHS